MITNTGSVNNPDDHNGDDYTSESPENKESQGIDTKLEVTETEEQDPGETGTEPTAEDHAAFRQSLRDHGVSMPFETLADQDRRGSEIPLELWNKNVNAGFDKSVFLRLLYPDRESFESIYNEFEDFGYWFSCTVDLITGQFMTSHGQVKINNVDHVNTVAATKQSRNWVSEKRKKGKLQYQKYMTFPSGPGQSRPFLCAVDLGTLKKICKYYDVPLSDIYDETREDLGLWKWVRENPVPVGITEGNKKSISVTACGVICISIPGVANGMVTTKNKRGKVTSRALHSVLKLLLNKCPRKIVLSYDADLWTNIHVKTQLGNFARLLLSEGHDVRIADWVIPVGESKRVSPQPWWKVKGKTAKGIDDLKHHHEKESGNGEAAVIASFEEAIPWAEFETKLLSLTKEQLWVAGMNARHVMVNPNGEGMCLLDKSTGIFEDIHKSLVGKLVLNYLSNTAFECAEDDEAPFQNDYSEKNMTKVVKLLDSENFIDREQLNPHGLLPLKNCYLTIEDGLPVASDYPDYENLQQTELGQKIGPFFGYRVPVVWNPEKWTRERCLDVLKEPLDCFDTQEQAIAFLKLVSVSLNVSEIRGRHGRDAIKAIILNGTGRNGKDTWRVLFESVYQGIGFVSIPMSEYKKADRGQNSTVGRLQDAKISWAPENKECNLNSPTLKAATSGDDVTCNTIYKGGKTFTPQCVQVFNFNDTAHLNGFREDNASRLVMIKLRKTFVKEPTKPNQVKANPQLRDPKYILENFSEPLLHLMVMLYQEAYTEGIDTSCFDETIQESVKQSNHLKVFFDDCLEPIPDGETNSFVGRDGKTYESQGIHITQLITALHWWYIREGSVKASSRDDLKQQAIDLALSDDCGAETLARVTEYIRTGKYDLKDTRPRQNDVLLLTSHVPTHKTRIIELLGDENAIADVKHVADITRPRMPKTALIGYRFKSDFSMGANIFTIKPDEPDSEDVT